MTDIISEAIAANPKAVADFRKGKEQALNAIMGYVLKQERWRNPKDTLNEIRAELGLEKAPEKVKKPKPVEVVKEHTYRTGSACRTTTECHELKIPYTGDRSYVELLEKSKVTQRIEFTDLELWCIPEVLIERGVPKEYIEGRNKNLMEMDTHAKANQEYIRWFEDTRREMRQVYGLDS